MDLCICRNFTLLICWLHIQLSVNWRKSDNLDDARARLSEECKIALRIEDAFQQKLWTELLPLEQDAMRAIGYDEEKWNDFERQDAELKSWADLDRTVQDALKTVEYTQARWDCDVIGEYLLPEKISVPEVDASPLPDRHPMRLASGSNELIIGYYDWSLHTAILASLMGRLLAGVYKLQIKLEKVPMDVGVYKSVEDGNIDMVLGDPILGKKQMNVDMRIHNRHIDFTRLFGKLDSKVTSYLYMVDTQKKSLPYYEDVHSVSLIPYWRTTMKDDRLLKWLPKKHCPDRKLLEPGIWNGFGVWCAPHLSSHTEKIPLIWATGPQFVPFSLMGFIQAFKLKLAIEFLSADDFFRRCYTAARVGCPALFWVEEPSYPASVLQGLSVKRIDMPLVRNCGEFGNWTHVGEWFCGASVGSLAKLGSKAVDESVLLRYALRSFDISDAAMADLFEHFTYIFDHEAEPKSTASALQKVIESWVEENEGEWKTWFLPPTPVATNGRIQILGMLALSMVVYLYGEVKARMATSGTPPDRANLRIPIIPPTEIFAGSVSTVHLLMDCVGIAAIMCSTTRLSGYFDVGVKHVLVGHTVGQLITLMFSRYETPICTPSVETLPFIKTLVMAAEQATTGLPAEHVIVTLLVSSMMISITGGTLMFVLGYFKLGSALKYIPYSVRVGVQGGMGVVLLSVGLELSCDVSFLDDWDSFFRPGVVWLWMPAFAAGLLLFCVGEFVTESPYTNLCFIMLASPTFHLVRQILGMSLVEAGEAGWLFEKMPTGSPFSLWQALRFECICWEAIMDNLATIFIASFVGPIINNVSDLAVIKSVLPPAVMGSSDFDHEILVQGRSHILLGLAGGFATDYGNDDTIVHRMLGGKRRLSMWIHIATLVLCIAYPAVSDVVPFVPKFVNGAVIAVAGFSFLYVAMVEGYHELVWSEYMVVIMFVLTCVVTQGAIEKAVIVGTFFGFGDFIVRYAHTHQVKFSSCKSATTWDTNELFRLDFCGLRENIVTAKLSGYVFFASAPELVSSLLAKMDELRQRRQPHHKVFIVDWKSVSGVDTAAVIEFERLVAAGREFSSSCLIIFCGMNQEVEREVRRAGLIAPVPDELKLAWPSTSQYLSRDDARSVLCKLDIPARHLRELGLRLGECISIDILSALVNHYVTNDTRKDSDWCQRVTYVSTPTIGGDDSLSKKATSGAEARSSFPLADIFAESKRLSSTSSPAPPQEIQMCELRRTRKASGLLTVPAKDDTPTGSLHRPAGLIREQDKTAAQFFVQSVWRSGDTSMASTVPLHLTLTELRHVLPRGRSGRDSLRRGSRRGTGSVSSSESTPRNTHEESEDDDGYWIIVVPALDTALHFAEVVQLQSCRSEDIVTDALFQVCGQSPFRASKRFRVLARALAHRSSLSSLLRTLVSDGRARLLSFHDDKVIQEPGQFASYLYILLAGSIVAFWPHNPVAFRHVSCHHVLCDEALQGRHSGIGYRAASSCVVLAIRPTDIADADRSAILYMLAMQSQSLRSRMENED